jgi:hypothetical protein
MDGRRIRDPQERLGSSQKPTRSIIGPDRLRRSIRGKICFIWRFLARRTDFSHDFSDAHREHERVHREHERVSLEDKLPARPAPLRVKHITIHNIVAGCCFHIGKGDNPLPARINSGIDYMKRCECITILGGVAGRGKGATGGSVGDRAHPNLARATAYYRRWPTSRPCLLAFRFTAATVLLIDLAIVVTGVFLRKWLFNSRKSSFVR